MREIRARIVPLNSEQRQRLAAWREGNLPTPPWCAFAGDRQADDFCWSWISGYELHRNDCRDCEFCLGMMNQEEIWKAE